jgi:type III secretory pathway component EscV
MVISIAFVLSSISVNLTFCVILLMIATYIRDVRSCERAHQISLICGEVRSLYIINPNHHNCGSVHFPIQ